MAPISSAGRGTRPLPPGGSWRATPSRRGCRWRLPLSSGPLPTPCGHRPSAPPKSEPCLPLYRRPRRVWGLAPRVWLTGAAGVSVLSFVAGFLVMRASLASHDVLGVPLSILGLARDRPTSEACCDGSSRRTTIIVLAVCLVLSLGLNLFAAGALVRHALVREPVGAAFVAAMQSYPPGAPSRGQARAVRKARSIAGSCRRAPRSGTANVLC